MVELTWSIIVFEDLHLEKMKEGKKKKSRNGVNVILWKTLKQTENRYKKKEEMVMRLMMVDGVYLFLEFKKIINRSMHSNES